MNTFWIITLIVVSIIGIAIIAFFLRISYIQELDVITKEELEEFYKTRLKIILTEEQKRLLSFGSIYSLMYENGGKALLIEPYCKLKIELESNIEYWGVYNTDDAKEVLADLVERKRTVVYDALFQYSLDEVEKIKELIIQLEEVGEDLQYNQETNKTAIVKIQHFLLLFKTQIMLLSRYQPTVLSEIYTSLTSISMMNIEDLHHFFEKWGYAFSMITQFPNQRELNKIWKEIAQGLEIDLSEVEKTQSTYAWDICRAVICRGASILTDILQKKKCGRR